MWKTKRGPILLFATSLITSVAHAAPGPGGGPPPAMPVEAEAVQVTTVNVDVSAVGTLGANEAVMIRPEIAGIIRDIYFKEGTSVQAGEKLLALDASEYRARLADSTAALKLKQLSFERAKKLREKKLSSQQEYDQDAALLEQAEAQRSLYEDSLRKTVIRAPFNGVLGLKRVSPGAYVQVGQDLIQLVDDSVLKLDFDVPEVYLPDLKPNLKVSLEVDALPDKIFAGQVFAIDSSISPGSRSITLRATVINEGRNLRPGMFARVKLQLAQRNNAIVVPEEAIWPIGQNKFVYKVVDNKVSLTKVVLGHRELGRVEIREGLAPGDVVVTAGQTKIREGAAIMVINQQAKAP